MDLMSLVTLNYYGKKRNPFLSRETQTLFCGSHLVPPATGGDFVAPQPPCCRLSPLLRARSAAAVVILHRPGQGTFRFSTILWAAAYPAAIVEPTATDKMDWQGQKLSENLMQAMLAIFAFIAFVTGYVMSSFQNMLIIYAAGVLLTIVITVPNWPFFNRHQLNWLDPSVAELNPKPDIQPPNTKKRTTKGHQK